MKYKCLSSNSGLPFIFGTVKSSEKSSSSSSRENFNRDLRWKWCKYKYCLYAVSHIRYYRPVMCLPQHILETIHVSQLLAQPMESDCLL